MRIFIAGEAVALPVDSSIVNSQLSELHNFQLKVKNQLQLTDYMNTLEFYGALSPGGNIQLYHTAKRNSIYFISAFSLSRKLSENEMQKLTDKVVELWTGAAGLQLKSECEKQLKLSVEYNDGEIYVVENLLSEFRPG